MIEKTYPSKKPSYFPTVYQHTSAASGSPFEIHQSRVRGCSLVEYQRRDALIKKLATDCGYQHGDTAYPKKASEYAKYGTVMITGVVRTYKDMEKDHKWENDNPMILAFQPLNNRANTILCTTGYLTKKNEHLCLV